MNLLAQEETLKDKEEENYTSFTYYHTQRPTYRSTTMRFSPPSIDFDLQLPNLKTKYPYPFPVSLGQKEHQDKVGQWNTKLNLQYEHEKSLYADQIMDFLNPFLSSLVNRQPIKGKESLFEQVLRRFEAFCKQRETEKDNLKRLLGVERYELTSPIY